MTMAAYLTYDGYKPTGIEWQPETPTHWNVVPILAIARVISEANQPELDLLSVYLGRGVILFSEVEEKRTNATSADLSKYQVVRPGNLVLNNQQAWRGSVGISYHTGIVSPAYIVLDLGNNFDPGFADYYFRTPTTVSHFLVSSKGVGTIQRNLYWPALRRCPVSIPPLPEQRAIAAFLDEKCAKVDEAVRIKEEQIALLRERRQILIQQAVIHGLNPQSPMKDSGIDWIGQIPAHWEVVRFKYLFTQSRLPVRKDDGVVTSYRDGQVTLRANRRMDGYTEAILEGGYQGIRSGQLVLNSMDAFEGAIGVSDSDGKCTPEYVICNPIDENINQYYFAHLLREMALADYIEVICNAVRQRAVRIRFNNLATRFMVLPPPVEQAEIVTFVEREKSRIADAIAIKEEQIAALKEYKTSLINAAVTGKIKVA
jgi:type I restriction enzyme S subunit